VKYQIREMTVDDIGEVIDGEMRVFSHTLGYDFIYTDLMLNPYAHYFVLEIDDTIQGYMGLWIEDRAQIINFYVEEAYRHMGFGSMMLEFVIELCTMSHALNITLEVRLSNVEAQRLYKKYGFTSSHVRKLYYENGEDALVMNKELEGFS